MIRRPPRSTRTDTLFPYTTLFRSEPFLSGHDWPHPVTVVHGHTPEGPTVLAHRIGVDSGVFASGCLTAVELSGDRLRFITAREERSEESSVGKERVSTCRSRRSRYH